MEYVPYYTSRVDKDYGYFGNTDKGRAVDWEHMFANLLVERIL